MKYDKETLVGMAIIEIERYGDGSEHGVFSETQISANKVAAKELRRLFPGAVKKAGEANRARTLASINRARKAGLMQTASEYYHPLMVACRKREDEMSSAAYRELESSTRMEVARLLHGEE